VPKIRAPLSAFGQHGYQQSYNFSFLLLLPTKGGSKFITVKLEFVGDSPRLRERES